MTHQNQQDGTTIVTFDKPEKYKIYVKAKNTEPDADTGTQVDDETLEINVVEPTEPTVTLYSIINGDMLEYV